jgi:hypothetical protein
LLTASTPVNAAPLGEGLQSQHQNRRAGGLVAGGDAKWGRFGHGSLAEQQPPKSPTNHQKDDDNKPVGGNREDRPRLFHPAQVYQSQDSDEAE